MDTDAGFFYTYDGKRLTVARVVGFALELGFQWVLIVDQFDVRMAHFSAVEVQVFESTSKTKRKVTFGVEHVHQQTIKEAVDDVSPRLHFAGYVIVGAVVPQPRHLAKHDVVVEHRKIGEPCLGKYSGELKLRTFPAKRSLMRSDCAGLFAKACQNFTKWLGQVIICIEMTSEGGFLRSRAELLVRGRSRNRPMNLWGWLGASSLSPPSPNPPIEAPMARAIPKAAASPPRALPPLRAAPQPTPGFNAVWQKLWKYNVDWTTDHVVLLKKFFEEMCPCFKTNVTNCSRVVKESRGASLDWRAAAQYVDAKKREEGRVAQGGGPPPIIVSKTTFKLYYDML